MNAQLLIQAQNQSNAVLLDNMMRGISTAEKLVYLTNPGKKYGYYDEKNSAEWKTIPELKAECILLKEIIQSNITNFINKYHTNFKFPNNLTQEDIIKDLKRFENIAQTNYYNNPEIIKYYSDMINLIKGLEVERCNPREVLYDYPDIKRPDCKRGANVLANQFFEQARNTEHKKKKNEKKLMENNGEFIYNAQLFIPPGRYGNKGNDTKEYYKKKGEYEEEDEDKEFYNC